jgi:hypothetical protein
MDHCKKVPCDGSKSGRVWLRSEHPVGTDLPPLPTDRAGQATRTLYALYFAEQQIHLRSSVVVGTSGRSHEQ